MENAEEETMELTTIYFDSKSATTVGLDCKDTKYKYYIMRHYHYVRENLAAKQFSSKWIRMEFQIADIGTKLNDDPRHKILMEIIMMKVLDQTKASLVQEG
jgi:hypothetical protein